jgi:hypothetical protein
MYASTGLERGVQIKAHKRARNLLNKRWMWEEGGLWQNRAKKMLDLKGTR